MTFDKNYGSSSLIADIETKDVVDRFSLSKQIIAMKVQPPQHRRLLEGTEVFAAEWLTKFHDELYDWEPCDISCYTVKNITVSGFGNIWFDQQMLVDPRIMPLYVRELLDSDLSADASVENFNRLPVREITEPCIVCAGHGTHVYGHFLIEMLFRLLVASYARGPVFSYAKFLLDSNSPSWLLKILSDYFDITGDRIVFFDPAVERVLVGNAVLPGRVLRDHFFHPFCVRAINDLKAFMPKSPIPTYQKVFIVRGAYVNPHAPRRIMLNEDDIADIATNEFGFKAIKFEAHNWADQISLFDKARIIVGQAGSSLHGSMFSKPDTIVASIGFMNTVQSEIAAAWDQRLAFLTHGVNLRSEYSVDHELFRRYIDAVVSHG